MVTFVYGPHAADMLVERDIDPLWVARTVLAPEATEPDSKHPARIRAFPVALSATGGCSAWYMSGWATR